MAKTELYDFTATNDGVFLQYADGTHTRLRFAELTDEIKHAAMVQGFKKKIVDGAALSRNTETGRSASDGDKIARMVAIAERLRNGDWRMSGAGEGVATGGYLMRALCELYPNRTVEQLKTFLGGQTEAQKIKLRASSKVAPIIERLKLEKARPSMEDEEELFAGLEEEDDNDD